MDSLALPASAGVDWQALWLALGLLVLAVALLVLELFVVSFGILLVGSIASAAAAIRYAFVASDASGWTMTAVVPILAVILARWGLARIRRSRTLVPKSEITAEAGYHHHAETVGVHPGAALGKGAVRRWGVRRAGTERQPRSRREGGGAAHRRTHRVRGAGRGRRTMKDEDQGGVNFFAVGLWIRISPQC